MNSMLNNPRFYLWLLLLMAGVLNYQAWETDYAPQQLPAAEQQQKPQAPDLGASIPNASSSAPGSNASTTAPPAAGTAAVPGTSPPAGTPAATAGVGGVPIHVRTDVLDLDID